MLSCVTRSYFKCKCAAFQKLYVCLWGVVNHSDIFVLQENDHELVYYALYELPWKNYILCTVFWEVCRRCCVFNSLSCFVVYVCTYGACNILFQHLISSSSSMALQPGVGLGLLYNTPPSLSIPCSVSPFVYSHLSQVRGHVIQPSHFWSSSSSCCLQLSVQHLFWNCGVLRSMWPSHRILWHLMNLTTFSPLITTSNSSFCRILQ